VLKMAIIVACFGVGGCAQEMRATATDGCLEFGATPGSLEFRECRELENEKSARFGAALVGVMRSPPLPTTIVLGLPR
jgi:hypothetical protein